jgi:ABC-type transport system involved in multi-copper enzyme maturation permease subunit
LITLVAANTSFFGLGLLAFALAAITLGAHAIGHEYANRTLGTLLAQPVERNRVFLTKLGVVSGLIGALAALAWLLLSTTTAPDSSWLLLLIVLSALAGITLAPWLTMVCRNQLAGVVFTVAIPAIMFLAAQLVAATFYGTGTLDSILLARTWWLAAVGVLLAMAAVLAWRSFMRLEVVEGTGGVVHMPAWLGRVAPAGAQHPVWMLTKKELHLQQITLVIVAVYLAGVATISLVPTSPELRDASAMLPLLIIYCVVLALLIGSLASAEERQFGTLEWQLLLPISAWRQWVIKVGVALGLAVVLGILLPSVVLRVTLSPQEWQSGSRSLLGGIGQMILLTSIGLYVSSVSTSGVRALAISFPAALALFYFTDWVNTAAMMVKGQMRTGIFAGGDAAWPLGLIVVTLSLALGYRNHRSIDRTGARIGGQLAVIALVLTLAVLLLGPI